MFLKKEGHRIMPEEADRELRVASVLRRITSLLQTQQIRGSSTGGTGDAKCAGSEDQPEMLQSTRTISQLRVAVKEYWLG